MDPPPLLYFFLSLTGHSFSPPALSTDKARPTRLQLVQHINCIRAVQVQLLCPTSPANVFHNVIWVCGANDRNLRGKPLLEWLRGKVAV